MTETFTLTQENVTSALREIAAENPGFVYTATAAYQETSSCVYMDPVTRKPSCLVGQVVHRLHGDDALALLREFDRHADDTSVKSDEWPAEILIDDEVTKTILLTAQLKQDGGETWGNCVEHALAAA